MVSQQPRHIRGDFLLDLIRDKTTVENPCALFFHGNHWL
jgi:hypothetical protein